MFGMLSGIDPPAEFVLLPQSVGVPLWPFFRNLYQTDDLDAPGNFYGGLLDRGGEYTLCIERQSYPPDPWDQIRPDLVFTLADVYHSTCRNFSKRIGYVYAKLPYATDNTYPAVPDVSRIAHPGHLPWDILLYAWYPERTAFRSYPQDTQAPLVAHSPPAARDLLEEAAFYSLHWGREHCRIPVPLGRLHGDYEYTLYHNSARAVLYLDRQLVQASQWRKADHTGAWVTIPEGKNSRLRWIK